jgi:hypothetical protein
MWPTDRRYSGYKNFLQRTSGTALPVLLSRTQIRSTRCSQTRETSNDPTFAEAGSLESEVNFSIEMGPCFIRHAKEENTSIRRCFQASGSKGWHLFSDLDDNQAHHRGSVFIATTFFPLVTGLKVKIQKSRGAIAEDLCGPPAIRLSHP